MPFPFDLVKQAFAVRRDLIVCSSRDRQFFLQRGVMVFMPPHPDPKLLCRHRPRLLPPLLLNK